MNNNKSADLIDKNAYYNIFNNMQEIMAIFEMIRDENENAIDMIIRDVNDEYVANIGIARENVINQKASVFYGPDFVNNYLNLVRENEKIRTGTKFETYFPPLDKYYMTTLFNIGKDLYVTLGIDITERKRMEEELEKSLKEKEVLLKEIHHRVKNNLQIISSLLSLQSKYYDNSQINIFKDSQARVRSMALIHETLYQSDNLSSINLNNYVHKLVANILNCYNAGDITPKIEIDNSALDIDTAIPCGLIINELLTNSIKYAFPNDNGTICIKLNERKGNTELIISDNGIGIPEHIDLNDVDTLGLKLVNTLVNQIKGTIEVNRNNGTTFTITFSNADRF